MHALVEDAWINGQAATHSLSEIEDCSIAVDATYYLQLFLDTSPFHEPLLSALGGLTGIQKHIEGDLDQWKKNKITPLFVFDGQAITGQDEVALFRGRRGNEKTDNAWSLYFAGNAEQAVQAFGSNPGAFRAQTLYPLLQTILKARAYHFLVPPYNAAAQIAYFDMIDSDQCAGIMGSQELLLYPIKDCVIKTIDWDTKLLSAISKKHIIRALNIGEPMFIDAALMTSSSFLPPFPPLLDPAIIKNQPFSISDAINVLRTAEKSVAIACTSFNDILQVQDPHWLDKYRKARMAISHFIYIAESGEIKVHDYDKLTKDNHEYLGLQLPSELFHYVNTGLIGSGMLSWITHGQLWVMPTLDGVASEEYRKLVQTQLVPIKEVTLGLLIQRLNRGIQFNNITMKVWYDRNFSYSLNHRNLQPPPSQRVVGWAIQDKVLKQHMPKFRAGSIVSEVLALKNAEVVKSTLTRERAKGLESADSIISLTIWRMLHLRGYINDEHKLTTWGFALAAALSALEPTMKKYPEVPYLSESVVVALEMLRFELLNARNRHEELHGLPMNGSQDDKDSLLLISRCATLLRLRHEANGYTGPLSKNLLAFRSLASEIRSADRALTEAIIASMFMYAQAKRERDDGWEISHQLPFLSDPDVALGIAVKTFLDEVKPTASKEQSARIKADFPAKYVPYATHFSEDLDIAYAFFDAVYAGVKVLGGADIAAADRSAWDKASQFLTSRR